MNNTTHYQRPRVIIGSRYERKHFEVRDRDGSYAALRPAMSADAELLQRALLTRKRQGWK